MLISNTGGICTVSQRYKVGGNGQDFLCVDKCGVVCHTFYCVLCVCQVIGKDLLGHFQLLQSCLVQSLRGKPVLKPVQVFVLHWKALPDLHPLSWTETSF